MKSKISFLSAVLFTVNLSTAQLLYTEDFESYNTGPFSTDHTGATPVQGGWYTWVHQPDPTRPYDDAISPSVNHFEIVSDPNKGKLINIIEEKNAARYINSAGHIERTDLNTYWQQRHPGNNVLKLAFDIYTEVGACTYQSIYVVLFNAKWETLVGFRYVLSSYGYPNHFASIGVSTRQPSHPNGIIPLGIILPADTWVTVEVYIDYDNDKVYFSVPSLNHTVVTDTFYPLFLTAGGDYDDNPAELRIRNNFVARRNETIKGLKIDNINLSAQNFTPTAGLDEYVSDKFNIFPNPATDVVTISNAENIGMEEVVVYDGVGRVVKSEMFEAISDVQLNIADLASGSYFLHIKTAQGTGIKKLVKK